jgi:hypothetical protein
MLVAICFSERSVDTQRTTLDDTLHNHSCENLKSYMLKLFRKFVVLRMYFIFLLINDLFNDAGSSSEYIV